MRNSNWERDTDVSHSRPDLAADDVDALAALAIGRMDAFLLKSWNPTIVELERSTGRRFSGLLIRSSPRFSLLTEAASIVSSLSADISGNDVLSSLQDTFLLFQLERDIEGYREHLEQLLQRRRPGAPFAARLDELSAMHFFYFWFCLARKVVKKGYPNLPLTVGRAFGHTVPTVRQYRREAYKILRG